MTDIKKNVTVVLSDFRTCMPMGYSKSLNDRWRYSLGISMYAVIAEILENMLEINEKNNGFTEKA